MAFAQNTAGTGGISGAVQDPANAVVAGAKVVVSNEAKGIRREMETNEVGVFVAPSLIPSDGYKVEISKPGFTNFVISDLTVQVGQTVGLLPRLTVAGASTEVSVTAEAPVINDQKTDVSQVVDSRQLLDLPINGRRVDNFVLLTPGVTSDGGFGLLSFRGTAGGNTFLTDGVDTTNQFYDENAGRTRTYNIAQDSVQEFQVVSSNFLPEYGYAMGGVVNTVTRSGSNSLHGTAYWFFRNASLNAIDPFANGIRPQDTRHQAGLSIGGPIRKDKLFYFFNGELQRRENPIVSSNSNTTYTDSRGNFTGASLCTTPATPAQCAAAVAFLSTRTVTQQVPRNQDVNLLFGKIDYQINDRHRFTSEMNYLDFRSPNGIQTQVAIPTGGGIGNNANTNVFDRTVKAALTSSFTATQLNELKFGMFKDRQFDPASPSLLPPFGPLALSIGNLSNVGYATSYPRTNPSELRFQAADTFTWVYGRHTIKAGVDYTHLEDYQNQLSNRYGTFSYTNLTNFALDFSGNTTGAKNWSSYSQRFGNPVFDITMSQFALFLQDEIHVTPRLLISPGIRYEYTGVPQPIQVNPAWPQTGSIPSAPINFAPRIGISYSVDDKTVLRGSYGMFYNRYITSAFLNLFENNGLYQPNYSLNGSNATQLAGGPVFPNILTAPPSVAGTASVQFADPSYRNSYSEQAEAAIERQIAKDTSLTVSYVWSRALHIVSAYDVNAAPATQTATYSIKDASGNVVGAYTTPLYTTRINPAFGTVLDIGSNNNSYYNGLIVQVNKRYSHWFQAQASYTWSHAIDYNLGGASSVQTGTPGVIYTPSFPTTATYNGNYQGEKGSAATDQRQRFVFNTIFDPRFTSGTSWAARNLINGWQLSAIATLGSSIPLTPTITTSGGVPAGALSTSTINGLGGSARVPFEAINSLDIGATYRVDARISHVFSITERVKLQLAFEANNVFNSYLLATGSTTAKITQQYSTVKNADGSFSLVPFANYGLPQATQAGIDGTTARRAQAVVRFSW
jgi:hypothetical protein